MSAHLHAVNSSVPDHKSSGSGRTPDGDRRARDAAACDTVSGRADVAPARAAAVMIQHTASRAAASMLPSALALALQRRGLRVALFRPQSQPVPGSRSARLGSADAAMTDALAGFRRLSDDFDFVVVDGTERCTQEVNWHIGDSFRMRFAAAAAVPVVLVADMECGDVIASLVGSHAVVTAQDRAQICGFVIDNFHGDPRAFADRIHLICDLTDWPYLGAMRKWPHAADTDLDIDALLKIARGGR